MGVRALENVCVFLYYAPFPSRHARAFTLAVCVYMCASPSSSCITVLIMHGMQLRKEKRL